MTGTELPGAVDLGREFQSVVAMLSAARGGDRASPVDRSRGFDRAPVPVTLLTGFLGSGKTTLLRQLLQGDHGLRLTAVVNDLGAVGVDRAVLDRTVLDGAAPDPGRPEQSRGLLSLADGCACCLLTDDLARTLDLAAGAEPAPDAIVIEASGAADPVSMATTIEAGPGLRLDGIVCVVDAERWPHWSRHPVLGAAVRRQLQSAHLVVLTKTDLVPERGGAEVLRSVTELAPGRQVLVAVDGRIDPAIMLGAAVRGVSFRPKAEEHRMPFRTETVRLPDPVNLETVTGWLEGADHGLIRAKGWLTDRSGRVHELQVVGRRWTLTGSDPGHEPAVVLIATERSALDRAAELLRAASVGDGSSATG